MLKAEKAVISTTIDCLAKCNDFDCLIADIIDCLDQPTFDSFVAEYGGEIAEEVIVSNIIIKTVNEEFGCEVL